MRDETQQPLIADLSRVHALVPVRGRGDGKARLGEALDAEEREALVLALLARTLDVLAAVEAVRRVHVVTADPVLRRVAASRQTSAVVELESEASGDRLNDALRRGVRAASAAGATAVLCLPADLPVLSSGAIERLLDAADAALTAGGGRPVVTVAPADARGGTNALLLAPPTIIEPLFGEASLEAHLRAAARAGASVQLVADPELGFDLDTPDDLERLDAQRLLELIELGTRVDEELLAATDPR